MEAAREAMLASLAAFSPPPTQDGTSDVQQASTSGVPADNAADCREGFGLKRVPKGTVGAHLREILPELQPATIRQLKAAIDGRGVGASTEAIGAELRRHEGTRYSRDERGLWNLLRSAEKEAAEATNTVPPAVP